MECYNGSGQILRVVYVNAQNGYSVVHLRDSKTQERVVLVGAMPSLVEADEVEVTGKWKMDARFGRQVQVETIQPFLPSTTSGVEKYLSSGAVPGVGKALARAMAEHFGDDLLDVLENHTERLTEVRGIGATKADAVAEVWAQKVGNRRALIALYALGIGTALAMRLLQMYRHEAISIVREQPYRLAREVPGVGFITADKLARALGMEKDAPERIEAGIQYFLEQQTLEGHCYLPMESLVAGAHQFLDVDEMLLPPVIQKMDRFGMIRIERDDAGEDGVYLPLLINAEMLTARRLSDMVAGNADIPLTQLVRAIAFGLSSTDVVLTAEQSEGVETCLSNQIAILTGGPGTGKTTVIRAVIAGLRYLSAETLLCAPTGRAAKRMTETTGVDARTIHRLLEYNPATNEFNRNRDNPLEATAVVVDEVSMIDLQLMAALLDALPQGCRLVLVGDKDQLESVGAGAVLRDCIESGQIPTTTLTQIHRQAEQSRIIVNAHRILHGEEPVLDIDEGASSDFFFLERNDPVACSDSIIELVSQRIPVRFGFDPIVDVQVLTPMYRGELGAQNLNRRLQQTLNPRGREMKRGERSFRVSDRVMQIRNDYNKEVFNGDIGFVRDVSDSEVWVQVADGRTVRYEGDDLDNLVLAYAVTIHKSQGSEYAAVVMAIHSQHFVMLRRNLLYTGITRGKQLVVVAGSRRALQRAVGNDLTARRYTRLKDRLSGRLEA